MASPHRRMKPEIRELVDWAAQHGWSPADDVTGSGHRILKHTSGATVVLPTSPSDYRGLANTKATIRRVSGLPSDSGPAARYRHERRRRPWERFNMDAAVREARKREEARAALMGERDALEEERAMYLAELKALDPRKEPALARLLARRINLLDKRIKAITE